ncbi:MAG: hypothetical protein WKF75_20830 [Singulisphaera sp.]
MLLPLEKVEQFFRLHRSLMFYVNRRLKVGVHEALREHRDLIDAVADENPFRFSEEHLEVVRSWKHLVTGTFYAFRQLRNDMVFLTDKEPVVAYLSGKKSCPT